MRKKLTLIFAMIFLSFLSIVGKGWIGMQYNNECSQSQIETIKGVKQCFSQSDNFIELNGERSASTTFSTIYSTAKNTPTKRVLSLIFSRVTIPTASIYSGFSYARSCDFPIDHKPQKELFFIFRNIRI